MTVQELSAGGLVSREGKVLLVKVCNLKQEEVWTFPKGHLEEGETPEQAAVREVEEETGWRCRLERPLLTVSYRFSRQGIPVAKKVQWFAMEPLEKVGKPDAVEVLETRWVPEEGVDKLLRYPSDHELLAAWRKEARA